MDLDPVGARRSEVGVLEPPQMLGANQSHLTVLGDAMAADHLPGGSSAAESRSYRKLRAAWGRKDLRGKHGSL